MTFTTDDLVCSKQMNQQIMDITTDNIVKEIMDMHQESLDIDRIQDERNSFIHAYSTRNERIYSMTHKVGSIKESKDLDCDRTE